MTRSYHHGNLRNELIQAARVIVERDGHELVSLRGIVEELQVSRGAPYRHFSDRSALLAEVAILGFQELEMIRRKCEALPMDDLGRLKAALRGFFSFVDAHPRMFILIYEGGLLEEPGRYPEIDECQKQIYDNHFRMLGAAVPHLDARERRLRMISLWATSYGYAKIRQLKMLQPYMVKALSWSEIENAVLKSAIGLTPHN
ncbi:TetR/AcrR family transcriptional regulator [Noviherbaspirillum sedimenti]|uniref:TetR/AcrR family transcriptional regulator n=1 Tax=Noviherbaspirillum sedimenti TaxID=2320865 RepID=A0A3A3G644_9BURK|nr:TetR/AcrR family transcriptional regulator [Noviherbaspirillum sedimenti]RJG04003.1 TetR/AcrR family transcriptional regulator [Noviherbaspirillum sedimenti]